MKDYDGAKITLLSVNFDRSHLKDSGDPSFIGIFYEKPLLKIVEVTRILGKSGIACIISLRLGRSKWSS